MARYSCQAPDAAGRQCPHPAWGQTCYCHWHNAALYWRVLRMGSEAQRRSAGWAYYDPGMIPDWTPPRFFPTGMVVFWALALAAVAAGRWVLGFAPPPNSTPLDLLINHLIFAAFLPLLAMFAGNSSRLLAKLFLIAGLALLGASAYRWATADAAALTVSALAPVVGAAALVVLALPPPSGPLRNVGVDPDDMTQLPPLNVGNSGVKGMGMVLVFGAGICTLLAPRPGLTPAAPPPEAAAPAEAPPPAAAPPADVPQPDGGFGLNSPLVAGVIFFLVGNVCATLGSFKSIRREWHHQEVYHRCVMPSVMSVCVPPQVVGLLLGLGLFYALTRFALLPPWAGLAAGGAACAACGFFGAWGRGSRIYAANVARATGRFGGS